MFVVCVPLRGMQKEGRLKWKKKSALERKKRDCMSGSVRDRNMRGGGVCVWGGGYGTKRTKCEGEDDGAEEGRKAQGIE